MKQSVVKLSNRLADSLAQKKYTVVTAESFTGGAAAYLLTRLPKSSGWFDRAFVTYSEKAKCSMLGINPKLIHRWNAVSEKIAKEMAKKALTKSEATLSISFTGLAGPDGGTAERPVGTVWLGFAGAHIEPFALGFTFKGNRQSIIEQALEASFQTLLKIL